MVVRYSKLKDKLGSQEYRKGSEPAFRFVPDFLTSLEWLLLILRRYTKDSGDRSDYLGFRNRRFLS
jgi:hypothetical protein